MKPSVAKYFTRNNGNNSSLQQQKYLCATLGVVMAPRSTYGDHIREHVKLLLLDENVYRLTLEPDLPIFINVMGLTLKSDIKYVCNTYKILKI